MDKNIYNEIMKLLNKYNELQQLIIALKKQDKAFLVINDKSYELTTSQIKSIRKTLKKELELVQYHIRNCE